MKKRCAVFTALLLLSLTAACSGRTAAQPPESSEAESEIIPGSTDEAGTETSSDTSGESEMETSSEAGSEPAPASPAVGTSEKAHADVLLTAPPEITLSDSLSSANTSFTLHSGTGEWSWVDKDEITTSVACGSAPLDMDPEQAAMLDVPDYNRLDSVPTCSPASCCRTGFCCVNGTFRIWGWRKRSLFRNRIFGSSSH